MINQFVKKKKTGNISIEWEHVTEEILGDNSGTTGIKVKSVTNDQSKIIPVDGIFIAIGHDPNTKIFKDQLKMNEAGYIEIHGGQDGRATATNIPGVFAAGDVADHIYRQAVTSAGFGCMAALDAEKYLDAL